MAWFYNVLIVKQHRRWAEKSFDKVGELGGE
jgi:hypothetical protein